MTGKQNKRVTVFNPQQYDGDWPPRDVAGFMAWFQQKIDSVSPEYREQTKINIDSESSYEDSHYVSIDIYYDRLETDSEAEARIKKTAASLAEEERRLMANLESIRARKAKELIP